jgi:ADP-heptose:LPS heptosyltransferase
MPGLGRRISLWARKSDSAKDRRRVLRTFAEWQTLQHDLPVAGPRDKTLLLIRLDDIGDYLLFRNQLGRYKQSPRWRDYRITLLGNESWRDLFTQLDADSVDETIWVGKNRYLYSAPYRADVWRHLRTAGFETVIAPSCTRPLLLDDLCTLAAAPLHAIGSVNSNVHAGWNLLSDRLYTELFTPPRTSMHEFHFNAQFAEWSCGSSYAGGRPRIDLALAPPVAGPYVICFVGASTRSRRWPVKRWIEFIKLHRRLHSSKLYLAGNGATELEMVRSIQRRTGVASIAGTVGLSELLAWVAGAEAVITNDTMAAHMGASFNRPTVIVANGINYLRFSDYRAAGIDRVATIFPEVVKRRRRREGDGPYAYSETVSADIASIRAATVIGELTNLVGTDLGRPAAAAGAQQPI